MSRVRFGLRGVLISRGHTRAITAANVTSLLLLTAAVWWRLLPFPENGALNAYCLWLAVLLVEVGILTRLVYR